MSKPVRTVTGLRTTGQIARTVLTWDSPGFSPLIDHFRVYAREGRAPVTADERHLVGKTVFPTFTHAGLDPAGSTFNYTVVAVDDAGRRSRPCTPVVGSSAASITATGTALATLGSFDGKSLEFQYSPSGYAKLPMVHPDAVIDLPAGVAPSAGWPYLLPGPGDAWAGKKVWTARWHPTLAAAPDAPVAMAVWLIDTTRLGGVLEVRVAGVTRQRLTLTPGGHGGLARRGRDPPRQLAGAQLPGVRAAPRGADRRSEHGRVRARRRWLGGLGRDRPVRPGLSVVAGLSRRAR